MWMERSRRDLRTKQRRRKIVRTSLSCLSSTTTTAAAAGSMQSVSTTHCFHVDAALSSPTTATSNTFEPSLHLGSSLACTSTSLDRNIKESTEGEEISVDDLDMDDHQPAYVFMDTEIMFSIFDELVKCPRCGFHVETSHLIHNTQALGVDFMLKPAI